MRRGLGSLLAVCAMAVLIGLVLEPTVALAAGGSSGVEHSGARIKAALLGLGDGYGRPRGSAAVRVLQRALARAGDTPGPIDGLYGPLTEHAVRRFQATHGLQVDGIAGPRTTRLLPQRTATHPGRKTTFHPHKPGSPHRRAHRRPTPAKAQSPSPVSVPAPRSVGQAHPSDSSSRWLVLLGALVLGLLLIAAWYLGLLLSAARNMREWRERASRRRAVVPEAEADQDSTEAALRRADQSGDARAAFILGLVLESQNDLAGAEAAYRRADQRGDARAAFILGVLLGERGDLAGAEAAVRRADQRGDAMAALNLGVLLGERGDLAGAKAAYRRAAQRGDPKESGIARAALLELHGRLQPQNGGRDGGRDR